ncbi:MAG: succinate dehydrogenase, cytochrome b556 subunit [Candidatus Sedimenticola sp. (ex Thyasira tokunagai)]
MQNSHRPVFLNLLQFRFPMAAIMSVGHRVAGVVMILAVPFVAYLLNLSLTGSDGFIEAKALLSGTFMKLVLFVVLWMLLHHLLAGIRYLLIDFDIGVEIDTARKSAVAVMVAAPVIAVLLEILI